MRDCECVWRRRHGSSGSITRNEQKSTIEKSKISPGQPPPDWPIVVPEEMKRRGRRWWIAAGRARALVRFHTKVIDGDTHTKLGCSFVRISCVEEPVGMPYHSIHVRQNDQESRGAGVGHLIEIGAPVLCSNTRSPPQEIA